MSCLARTFGEAGYRAVRHCCAWTRRHGSRRWTGLHRSGRCNQAWPGPRSHDDIRYGTPTLFAAVEIASGQVTGACKARHRHQRVPRVPQAGRPAYPDVEPHLEMDNHAAHEHPAVKA